MYIGPWQEYKLSKLKQFNVSSIREEIKEEVSKQLLEGSKIQTDFEIQNIIEKKLLSYENRFIRPQTSNLIYKQNNKLIPRRCYSSTIVKKNKITDNENNICNNNKEKEIENKEVSVPIKKLVKSKTNHQNTKNRKISKSLTSIELVNQRKKLYKEWIKDSNNVSDIELNKKSVFLPDIKNNYTELSNEEPKQNDDSRIENTTNKSLKDKIQDNNKTTDTVYLPPIQKMVIMDEDEVDDLVKWTQNLQEFNFDEENDIY